MEKIMFTDDDVKNILTMYNDGYGSIVIGKEYGVSKTPILKILKKHGVVRKNTNNDKIILNQSQKNKIKQLYLEKNKNSKEIGKIMGFTSSFIEKYLSKVDYRRSKSDAMRIYKTGKKLPPEIIQKLTEAQIKLSRSGKRKQCGGVCKIFDIDGLKCQGTYEKFYIEKLKRENKKLPSLAKPIITPYGVYNADFFMDGKLIEIKSDYTYDVLVGKKISRYSKKIETKQYNKIRWVNENYLPVEIIVVDKKNNKLINKDIK